MGTSLRRERPLTAFPDDIPPPQVPDINPRDRSARRVCTKSIIISNTEKVRYMSTDIRRSSPIPRPHTVCSLFDLPILSAAGISSISRIMLIGFVGYLLSPVLTRQSEYRADPST